MSTYNLNSNDEIIDQEVKTEEILYEEEPDEQNVEILPTEVTTTKLECLHHLADEQMEELECGEYFEDEEYDDEQELDNDDLDEEEDENNVGDVDDDDVNEAAMDLTLNEEEVLKQTEENTEIEIAQEFVKQPEEEQVGIADTKIDGETKLLINLELTKIKSPDESPSEIIPKVVPEKPPIRTRVHEKFYNNTKTEQILETKIEATSIKKSIKKFSKPTTSTDKKPTKNLPPKPTFKSQKSAKIDLNITKLEKLSNPRPNSQSKSKPKFPHKSHYNFDSLLSSSNNSSVDGAFILYDSTKGTKSEPETDPFKGNKARSRSTDKNKPFTTTTKTNNINNNNNNTGKSKNSLQKRNSQTQRAAKTKGEWITRDTLLLRAKDDLVSVVPPTQGSWGFNAAAMWVDGYPATFGEHYWTVQFGSIGTSDFFAGGRCGVSSRDRMKALKGRGLLYGGNVANHGELTNGSKVLVKRFGRAVKSNDRIGILVSFFEGDPLLSPTASSRNKNGSFSAPGSRNGSKVNSRSLLPSKSGGSSSSASTIQYQEDPIQGQRRLSVYFYHNGRCLGLGFRVPASLFPTGVYPMVQFNVENGSARIWKEPKGNIPPLSNRSPIPIKHRGIEGYWRAVGGAVKGADEELTRKFNEVLKRGRLIIDELNFPNNNNNNNNNNSGSTTSKTKDKNREYKISVLLQKYRIIFFARKSPSAWTWTFSGYPLGRNGKSEGKILKKVFKFPESVTLEPNPNGEKMSLVKGKFTVNFIRKDFTPFIGNSFREHEAV